MIRHILLIKFKPEATGVDIKNVESAFLEIPTKIAGLTSVEWGINNSPENLNSDFTHSVLMTFESDAVRLDYLDHPEHVALKNIFVPVLDKIIVFDYSV